MTLYELKAEFAALRDMSEELDEQTFADTMEAINAELDEKADAYAAIIREMRCTINAATDEINRLMEKREALKNRIDILKENLTDAMIMAGRREIRTRLNSFTIQKNPPKAVITVPFDEIPAEFYKDVRPEVDRAKILSALKLGADLHFAHLEQGEGVRIR